jgi:hypothetical protein
MMRLQGHFTYVRLIFDSLARDMHYMNKLENSKFTCRSDKDLQSLTVLQRYQPRKIHDFDKTIFPNRRRLSKSHLC